MRSTKARLGAIIGVAVLLLLAVLGAAAGGPWQIEERDFRFPQFSGAPVPLPSEGRVAEPTPAAERTAEPAGGSAFPIEILIGILVGLLVIAVAVVILVLWLRYHRLEEPSEPQQSGISTQVESVPEVPVLRQGVAAARRLLDQIADPNNAIVAAWMALEEAAASSGVERQPAQTPTEFTTEVLAKTSADQAATQGLLRLYHRARFSGAGVGRAAVAEADDYLAALARSWRTLHPSETPDRETPDGPTANSTVGRDDDS